MKGSHHRWLSRGRDVSNRLDFRSWRVSISGREDSWKPNKLSEQRGHKFPWRNRINRCFGVCAYRLFWRLFYLVSWSYHIQHLGSCHDLGILFLWVILLLFSLDIFGVWWSCVWFQHELGLLQYNAQTKINLKMYVIVLICVVLCYTIEKGFNFIHWFLFGTVSLNVLGKKHCHFIINHQIMDPITKRDLQTFIYTNHFIKIISNTIA